jgi:hypothetical protein
LPADAIPKAKKAIADTFAAVLSGVGSEVAEPLMRYVEASHASRPCPFSAPRVELAGDGGARERHVRARARLRRRALDDAGAPERRDPAALLASLDGKRLSGAR